MGKEPLEGVVLGVREGEGVELAEGPEEIWGSRLAVAVADGWEEADAEALGLAEEVG